MIHLFTPPDILIQWKRWLQEAEGGEKVDILNKRTFYKICIHDCVSAACVIVYFDVGAYLFNFIENILLKYEYCALRKYRYKYGSSLTRVLKIIFSIQFFLFKLYTHLS